MHGSSLFSLETNCVSAVPSAAVVPERLGAAPLDVSPRAFAKCPQRSLVLDSWARWSRVAEEDADNRTTTGKVCLREVQLGEEACTA